MPHIMLGSVAQRIVQIASVPVTVVKVAREAPAPEAGQ
jgi:nucleotide-binding universal stress UspA family protein